MFPLPLCSLDPALVETQLLPQPFQTAWDELRVHAQLMATLLDILRARILFKDFEMCVSLNDIQTYKTLYVTYFMQRKEQLAHPQT